VKITKKQCKSVINALNAQGKRMRDSWIGALNQITNEPDLKESVASLHHMLLCNVETFVRVATQKLPKYLEDHPELNNGVALYSLLLQLCIRMVVYTYKHTLEVNELEKIFDMSFEDKKD